MGCVRALGRRSGAAARRRVGRNTSPGAQCRRRDVRHATAPGSTIQLRLRLVSARLHGWRPHYKGRWDYTVRMDGRGSDTRGRGPRITTAAGDSRPAFGSGFQPSTGDLPGSHGRRAWIRRMVPARVERPPVVRPSTALHGDYPWHAWTVVPSRRFDPWRRGRTACAWAQPRLPRSTTFITAAPAPCAPIALGSVRAAGRTLFRSAVTVPFRAACRSRAVPSMPGVRSPGVTLTTFDPGPGFDRDVAVPRRGRVGGPGDWSTSRTRTRVGAGACRMPAWRDRRRRVPVSIHPSLRRQRRSAGAASRSPNRP